MALDQRNDGSGHGECADEHHEFLVFDRGRELVGHGEHSVHSGRHRWEPELLRRPVRFGDALGPEGRDHPSATASSPEIWSFSPSGTDAAVFAARTAPEYRPGGLAINSSGDVWVAVQSTDVGGSIDGYVVEYSPSGTELTLFYASGLTNPTSIAVLQNGNLAVTDSTSNKMDILTPSGGLVSTTTSIGGGAFYGVTADPSARTTGLRRRDPAEHSRHHRRREDEKGVARKMVVARIMRVISTTRMPSPSTQLWRGSRRHHLECRDPERALIGWSAGVTAAGAWAALSG
jgi:hypothetical protein